MPPTGALTVRTGKGYTVDFAVDLGQSNAEMRRGVLTPLRRFVRWGDAVTWLPNPGTDLYHTWNAVPITRKPFVISFEDYLPRTPDDRPAPWLERALLPRLQRPNCVALLALSEYAVRQFRSQHRDYPGLSDLEAKVEVFYPRTRVAKREPKDAPDELRLLFVGNDHMRKGLPALVRAHETLAERGVPVETTVVSALQWDPGDYIGPPSEEVAGAEAKRLRKAGVRCLPAVPNQRVLELMDEATFLVLPTLHDTFGFVAVEALATGTPVIATRTCALPEVVSDGETGYLLPLENDPDVGKWTWTYRNEDPGYADAYLAAIDAMGAAMADRLSEFWEAGRPDYERMSAASLARAEERFAIDEGRRRLEGIYKRCAELAAR